MSFGSWIAMKLLMRRPEIEGFVAIAAPANRFDFSFLAPCPRSGLFIDGDLDRVAPLKEVIEQIDKLKTHKDAVIEHAVVPGANHFFENRIEPLIWKWAPISTSGSAILRASPSRRAQIQAVGPDQDARAASA